jgi:hypothetical protein
MARQAIPKLFDRAVRNCLGDLVRGEGEMSEAAAPEGYQRADFGAVGREACGLGRQR